MGASAAGVMALPAHGPGAPKFAPCRGPRRLRLCRMHSPAISAHHLAAFPLDPRLCSVPPRHAPHIRWSANCGQNGSTATGGNASGAMILRSSTATAAATPIDHRAIRRRGRKRTNTHAQKVDTARCTIAAAASRPGHGVSIGTSMAPAARVGSSGSAPEKSAHRVDGAPERTVAASQARKMSALANVGPTYSPRSEEATQRVELPLHRHIEPRPTATLEQRAVRALRVRGRLDRVPPSLRPGPVASAPAPRRLRHGSACWLRHGR
jgi:hypothetical protein